MFVRRQDDGRFQGRERPHVSRSWFQGGASWESCVLSEGTRRFWEQKTREFVACVLSGGGTERAEMTFREKGRSGHL